MGKGPRSAELSENPFVPLSSLRAWAQHSPQICQAAASRREVGGLSGCSDGGCTHTSQKEVPGILKNLSAAIRTPKVMELELLREIYKLNNLKGCKCK